MKIKNIFESKETLKDDIYTDSYGRKWSIIASDRKNDADVYLATWNNYTTNRINMILIVKGENKVWQSSIDGPFTTKKLRDIYVKNLGKRIT